MVFHVSVAESVEVLAMAQRKEVPVFSETCPHYLFMTEDVLKQENLEGAKIFMFSATSYNN